jgi:hypothetical protein
MHSSIAYSCILTTILYYTILYYTTTLLYLAREGKVTPALITRASQAYYYTTILLYYYTTMLAYDYKRNTLRARVKSTPALVTMASQAAPAPTEPTGCEQCVNYV